jgi:DNA-directed RNA polymerase subunit beta'
MVFKNFAEVEIAHSLGKVDTHAKIKVKLPPVAAAQDRRTRALGKPGAVVIETTAGRVLFNSILPEGMLFYNIPMRSSELAA